MCMTSRLLERSLWASNLTNQLCTAKKDSSLMKMTIKKPKFDATDRVVHEWYVQQWAKS